MQEAVSDILVERAQITEGMSRMVVVSFAGHALLVAALLTAPGFWTGRDDERTQPMMITLGGAEGPDAGGMTTISARPVQRVAEPDEKPSRPTPPAEKPPEMVAPKPEPKPAPKTPSKPVEKPKESSSSKKPTAGEEIRSGSAKAETGGAPVPFGGLSTGGGGTGGARVEVPNFCCQAYLESVVGMIKRNWNSNQQVRGQNTIRFVIQRDGTITSVHVDESGGQLLDIASQRALLITRRVQPLPPEFTPPTLTVYLVFDYSRR
jgi:outer membrane biosynthesis protein TonB